MCENDCAMASASVVSLDQANSRKRGRCSTAATISPTSRTSSSRISVATMLPSLLVVLLISSSSLLCGAEAGLTGVRSARQPNRKRKQKRLLRQAEGGSLVVRGGAPTRSEHGLRQHKDSDEKRCFTSNAELKAAVQRYKSYHVYDEELARAYGWPMANWCTSQVDDFSGVFQDRRTFNEPLDGWDTSRATSMASMFQNCHKFNQSLAHFDTSNVMDFSNMFESSLRFNGNGLERWNTERTQVMDFMFLHALQFNADITAWDVRNVKSMKGLFRDARSFAHDVRVLSQWKFHDHVDKQQMCDWWSENTVTQTTSLLIDPASRSSNQ